MSKKSQYALYKGDRYMFGGTKEELAIYLEVKKKTIDFYLRPAYKKRVKNSDDRYEVIKVECD